MKKGLKNICYLIVGILLFACSNQMDQSASDYAELISTFDFETADQFWDGGISDYPVDYGDSMEYVVRSQQLDYSNSLYSGKGMSITADNPHGDLFYFFKRKVSGFKPNTNYKVDFDFLVYSQSHDEYEIAEEIYLKVGAVNVEPHVELQKISSSDQGYVTLNLDKGMDNAGSGTDLVNIGSIKKLTSLDADAISGNTFDMELRMKTDVNGDIWLLIGVDSGLRSPLTFSLAAITVYYSEILG
jgi:hypothetical protein